MHQLTLLFLVFEFTCFLAGLRFLAAERKRERVLLVGTARFLRGLTTLSAGSGAFVCFTVSKPVTSTLYNGKQVYYSLSTNYSRQPTDWLNRNSMSDSIIYIAYGDITNT